MRKPLFLLVVALGLIVAPPGGIFMADAGDVPGNVTWYANSPAGILPSGEDSGLPLTKFIDSLPGVSNDGGLTNANNLGQYIPLAAKDTSPIRVPIIMSSASRSSPNGCIRTCSKPPNSGAMWISPRIPGSAPLWRPPDRGRAQPAGADLVSEPIGPDSGRPAFSYRWIPP